MHISASSITRIVAFSTLVVLYISSCKNKNSILAPVIDEVGHVGIYASEKNLNALLDLVQVSHSLLDSHLIIDDFSGDVKYENFWNFTIIENEEFIKNHRIVLTNESLDYPNKYDTSFAINDKNIYVYKNAFGLGQAVIDIDDFSLEEMNTPLWSKELYKVINYCNNSIDLITNDYSKQIQSAIKNQFGISVEIPSNFKVFKSDSSFLWISALKPNGGYLSFCIETIPQNKLPKNLNEAIEERNSSSKLHFFNDEGTTMAVSDLGNYKARILPADPIKYQRFGFQGWFTELGTTRRGPFERKYFVKNDRVIIVDWFSQGGTSFAGDARLLRKMSNSIQFSN